MLPLVLLFVFSCYYEEGPFFSFSTAKARIVNKWKYSKVEENNADITADYTNQYLEFKKNGDVIYFIDSETIINGSWTLAEDRRSVKVICTDDDGNSWNEDYNILKLKKDDLWMEDTFGEMPKRYELETY